MIKALTRAGLAMAASLSLTSAANAAFVFSVSDGAPDPGPTAVQDKLITFDSGLPAGVTLLPDAAIVSGSLGGIYASPALDASPFLTVALHSANGSGGMQFAPFLNNMDVVSFSFYWGSIDSYNHLTLLNRSGGVIGVINGLDVANPANGNQTVPQTNRRVFVQLSGADRQLGGLLYETGDFAFETDTYAFQVVPEPATWAMMIGGFFGAGTLIRRRKMAVA